MKLEDYAAKNGQIVMSLLPNGIVNEGEQAYLSFSLLFGLYVDNNHASETIEIDKPMELLQLVSEKLNRYAFSGMFQVSLLGQTFSIPVSEKNDDRQRILNNESLDRWDYLLDHENHKYAFPKKRDKKSFARSHFSSRKSSMRR